MLGAEAAKRMIKTVDFSKKSEDRSPLFMLVRGQTGTGKTTSIRTAVPFGKVVMIDIDRNSQGLFGDYGEDDFTAIHIGTGLTDGQAIEALEWQLSELAKRDDIACLVLDSLTTLSMLAMENVLRKNGRPGQMPQLQDYNVQMNLIQRLVLMVGAVPVKYGSIVMAHTELERDEATGRYIHTTAVTGKLSTRILRFFGEIYFAETVTGKDSVKWVWRTKTQPQFTARTGLDLDDEIEQDFAIPFKKHFD